MPEETINQKFRLKKIDEKRNQNKLMSKSIKKQVEFWIILTTHWL